MDALKINTDINNSSVTLSLIGRLDTTSSPVLDEAILGLGENIDQLILDFEELSYISSAGLRVLLTAQKSFAKKDGMTLKNVNPSVMEIFEITGFSEILNISNG